MSGRAYVNHSPHAQSVDGIVEKMQHKQSCCMHSSNKSGRITDFVLYHELVLSERHIMSNMEMVWMIHVYLSVFISGPAASIAESGLVPFCYLLRFQYIKYECKVLKWGKLSE